MVYNLTCWLIDKGWADEVNQLNQVVCWVLWKLPYLEIHLPGVNQFD